MRLLGVITEKEFVEFQSTLCYTFDVHVHISGGYVKDKPYVAYEGYNHLSVIDVQEYHTDHFEIGSPICFKADYVHFHGIVTEVQNSKYKIRITSVADDEVDFKVGETTTISKINPKIRNIDLPDDNVARIDLLPDEDVAVVVFEKQSYKSEETTITINGMVVKPDDQIIYVGGEGQASAIEYLDRETKDDREKETMFDDGFYHKIERTKLNMSKKEYERNLEKWRAARKSNLFELYWITKDESYISEFMEGANKNE